VGQVAVARAQCSYEVAEASNGEAWVRDPVTHTLVSPSQVAASVLMAMRKVAEAHLGQSVRDVVVTVPAYFNDNQRQATRNAGHLAGLNVVRVVNEPTAAALSYGVGLGRNRSKDQTVAVYDFGGGTFDISVLRLDKDGTFEVLATNGNTFLGGEDVDTAVATYLEARFREACPEQMKEPDAAAVRMRLRQAAEKAKIDLDEKARPGAFLFIAPGGWCGGGQWPLLSMGAPHLRLRHFGWQTSTSIDLPFLYGSHSFHMELSRAKFDELILPVIRRTVEPCRQCLRDAGVAFSALDKVGMLRGSGQGVWPAFTLLLRRCYWLAG
jgi:molecular chaperone DnaK